MKTYYLAALSLLSVIFVSGCTGLPDIFGSDVLNIQQNVVQGSPNDVLSVNDVQVIPSSSILPDQDVTITFNLENNDLIRKASNTIVDIFNAPSFRKPAPQGITGQACNAAGCLPDKCNKNIPCNVLPGEQKQVTVEMKAPSQGDIAGIKTDAVIDYKVNYDFESAFVYVVPVVNLEEIKSRQRANEKTTIEFSKSQSSGPLRIDAELVGESYILSGHNAAISFKVQNRGSGTVKNSIIEQSSQEMSGSLYDAVSQALDVLGISLQNVNSMGIIIIFPPELQPVDNPDNFECFQHLSTRETLCYNKEPIQMYKDETRTTMRFVLEPTLPEDTPYRSYTIKAFVGYNYELRNSIKATINPWSTG